MRQRACIHLNNRPVLSRSACLPTLPSDYDLPLPPRATRTGWPADQSFREDAKPASPIDDSQCVRPRSLHGQQRELRIAGADPDGQERMQA